MKNNIKIYHTPLEIEIKDKVTGYYLLITEACGETGAILATYICSLPVWVHDELFSEYEYYQPTFN